MDFVDLIEEIAKKLGLDSRSYILSDVVELYIYEVYPRRIADIKIYNGKVIIIPPTKPPVKSYQIDIKDPNFIQKFHKEIKSFIKKRHLPYIRNKIADITKDLEKVKKAEEQMIKICEMEL